MARSCKPFSKAALARGTKIEHREHPEFSVRTAKKIARDHLCEHGNRAYPKKRVRYDGYEVDVRPGSFRVVEKTDARPPQGHEKAPATISAVKMILREWARSSGVIGGKEAQRRLRERIATLTKNDVGRTIVF